jgi:1-acyl-sn-glycerol-3-phosphate acyltransferase
MKLRAAVASGACGLVPGFYELFTKLGAFECTKPFMQKVLREDKDVAVFPGGALESRYAIPGRYVCVVKHRKGFVRLALEERRDLLPMYTFGDEALLPQMAEPPRAIVALQDLAKEVFGLLVPPTLAGLPQFPPLTLITGVPISLEDLWPENVGGEVSQAAVDEAHARYVSAMQALFDTNKAYVPGGHAKAVIEFI